LAKSAIKASGQPSDSLPFRGGRKLWSLEIEIAEVFDLLVAFHEERNKHEAVAILAHRE